MPNLNKRGHNMPNDENNARTCTPIAISLFVAPKGDKHHITLGVIKGCKDNGESTWSLTFLLEEKDGDEWKKRVDFKLDINVDAPAKTGEAEKLAAAGRLNDKQARFAAGPMYVAAIRESQTPFADAELLELLQQEANDFDALGESKGESRSTEASAKIDELYERSLSARPRPGLKQLSIMFLDIK
jgi:hypothetical protein